MFVYKIKRCCCQRISDKDLKAYHTSLDMNLLGTSGVPEDDESKHARIKTNVTSHLKMCIKALQNEYVISDTPIHSGDHANALCNVLEAIFLHQLKPSIGSKLSSYLAGHSPDINTQLSCWPFLQRFTHKDVVSQLNRLSQINTDIGMCRAWIRLALNDALLENYLDAMIADSETCRYFYKRTAYMRDLEQPGIMKTYIQGLSNLNFQLSCNSSVLNVWTTAPVILTGHTEPPQCVSPAAAPSVVARPVSLPSRIAQSHFVAVRKMSPDGSSSVGHPVNVRRHRPRRNHLPATPPNTPFSPHLTRGEIDVIRQMALGGRRPRSDDSSSTATSQISHPDPTDGRLFDSIVSPSSLQLTPSSSRLSVVSEDVDSQRWLQDVPSVVEFSERGVSEVTFSNESLQHLDAETVSAQSSDVGIGLGSLEDEMPDMSTVTNMKAEQVVDNVNILKIYDEAVIGGSDEHTAQEDTMSVMDESQHVPVAPSEVTEAPRQFTETKHESSPYDVAATRVVTSVACETATKDNDANIPKDKAVRAMPEFSPVRRATALEPQLSDVMAFCMPVDRAQEADCDTPDRVSIDSRDYQVTDVNGVAIDAVIQGNSLGCMQGWSSEFENGVPETRLSIQDGGLSQDQSSTTAETFRVLLDNYDPSTLQPNVTTLGDTLVTTPNNGVRRSSPTTQLLEKDSLNDIDELQIDGGTGCSVRTVDPRYEHLVELVGEICHEKGLDVQNYQCCGCSRPIGMFYGKARECTYNACYYCYECHENDEYYIPSRIIHNWDFRKHKVCKQNLEFLQQNKTAPLFNVQKINRRLYDHVNEMNNSRLLRLQLRLVKMYLFTCKQCVADELRRRMQPREYLYEDIHVYSLVDLLQIHENQFAHRLTKVVQFATKHIYNCPLCRQKGFICEICDNPQVIYPFQLDTTTQCAVCLAVFHSACKTDLVKCPKCARYELRRMRLGGNLSSGMDYADDPVQER